MGCWYMSLGIIGALPLEHRIDDAHQLVSHMRERDQMGFAALSLAVIDGLKHGIEATGGERGMPDRPAQVSGELRVLILVCPAVCPDSWSCGSTPANATN